ncbi:carbohydrate kinase family protein [Phycicoccus sonneratiae]|uniref:Carbohydrate kinase family protein n=1 Tax=Phycicoccus sonneratiae TaxID=2807628 RepID=A0ABS2CP82_9MICO|nr:carbohydrate kinase family protein [Phycicoccus sonneraticus]MBM6401686.1 carbohydrate kinase family protein [Phycicoccus sonneraticus]
MTTEPFDVVVLGEANPDLVLRGDVVPRFGQSEQLLDHADLVLGGSGAITAHALARLGVRVGLMARVGDDVFGAETVRLLRAGGVDCSLVEVGPEPTGLSVVLSDGSARATLTLVGAIDAPAPEWRTPADVPPTRHLHVSSFFLQRRRAAALPRMLPLVRAAGVRTSLDTNLDPEGRFPGLAEVLPLVDLLLPNAEECRASARALGVDAADLVGAARALAARGPTVVVKDGADGALLVGADRVVHEPGTPVEPVDTTGAGDTFDAALVAALLEGRPEAEALARACAAGALSTRRSGGTAGQPTAAELDAALAPTATRPVPHRS